MKTVPSRRLRDMALANGINDGNRPLAISILVPEVYAALKEWGKTQQDPVLIGGAALSHWAKPRTTQDLDFLFLTEDIPTKVPGFKKTRPHAYQNNKTHVEVETLTPKHLGLSNSLVEQVRRTAVEMEGIRIASPEALVALKLGRFSRHDQADIEALKALPRFNWTVEWDSVLTNEQHQRFVSI